MSKKIEMTRREKKKQQKLERLVKKEAKKTTTKKVAKDYKENLINRTSRALTENEYEQILDCVLNGFTYEVDNKTKKFRRNEQVALALTISANVGLRLGDIVLLKVGDVKNGNLKIMEQKTKKIQDREISPEMYQLIMDYALERGLKRDDFLIDVGERSIQKQLKIVRDYLGLKNVSSHSFRKTYATNQYNQNGYNIRLVQKLLNHSSAETTEKYIGIEKEEVDKASSSYVMGVNKFSQII